MRVWITDSFAETGWLELYSKYLSVWMGFLYTVDSIELGVGLVRVSRKGSPSVPRSSVVNLMCVQKMHLAMVNSRSFINFSLGILQTLVKLVQIDILELTTCRATGTGMLLNRALISNETKVSSSGFIVRCLIFWMKSALSLTNDEDTMMKKLCSLSFLRFSRAKCSALVMFVCIGLFV